MENKPTSVRARKRLTQHLEQINLYAAGIDIGSENHYVAVPEPKFSTLQKSEKYYPYKTIL